MTAREVARLHGVRTGQMLVVRREDDDAFTVAVFSAIEPSIATTADALAQLVCDLGAHVGPVADFVSSPNRSSARWDLPSPTLADRCVYAHPGRVEVVTPAECTPQEARRLALTLLVAAAEAETQEDKSWKR